MIRTLFIICLVGFSFAWDALESNLRYSELDSTHYLNNPLLEIDPQIDYFGGWPINMLKDQIKDPGLIFDCESDADKIKPGCPCLNHDECFSGLCFNSPKVGRYCLQGEGDIFPRYKLTDQYGEEVDLYDFANHEKMILIELSTSWCAPCRKLASWLVYDDMSITENRAWKSEYGIIKELIERDQIYFINIQIQDIYKQPSSLQSLEDWFQEYPDYKIPILADSDYHVRNWARVTAYPTMILLNEKMEIIQFSVRGWHDSFSLLSGMQWDFKEIVE